MRVLAERYGVPAKALKGESEVEEAQAQRAQQQAQQEQMAMQSAEAEMQATRAGGMKDAASAAESQQMGGMM
jgi:hypothetical protein